MANCCYPYEGRFTSFDRIPVEGGGVGVGGKETAIARYHVEYKKLYRMSPFDVNATQVNDDFRVAANRCNFNGRGIQNDNLECKIIQGKTDKGEIVSGVTISFVYTGQT